MTNFLVFTDLDGTLLDHHSYSYEEAMPAVHALGEAGSPLIFNSSKTAAEIIQLRYEMGNVHPFIVENGSAVCIPTGYFNAKLSPGLCIEETYEIHSFGPGYQPLLTQLHALRSKRGYRFRGFADLNSEDVAQLTGLGIEAAAMARQRAASEPLLWDDSEEALENFQKDLQLLQLRLTRGGRFHHVMGQSDKAQALQWLTDRYRATWPDRQWTTVALGDGANDVAMLEAADIAVTMSPADGEPIKLNRSDNVICPEDPGPRGWQNAIEKIMSNATKKELDHG